MYWEGVIFEVRVSLEELYKFFFLAFSEVGS